VVPRQQGVVGAAEGGAGARMSTSWLVTGARGQLGLELCRALAPRRDDDVVAADRGLLDLTDETGTRVAVRRWLTRSEASGRRAVLVNAAAYSAVDAAESDEATAHVVNGAAPGWLAEELAGRGRLVHVSTDYVFDGTATRPYREDDEPAPRTAYGRTKLAGERAIAAAGGDAVVVRTAWLYAAHGTNFVRTMLRLAAEGPAEIRVVDDQTGSPTWARELAQGLVQAAGSPIRGVLHATNTGATTWWGLARSVFELAGADPDRVAPTTTAEFSRPAPRPVYSVLDTSRWAAAGLDRLADWDSALRSCLADPEFRDSARAARQRAFNSA
jgi:dTDP-4-dehydrorhamnose reductase